MGLPRCTVLVIGMSKYEWSLATISIISCLLPDSFVDTGKQVDLLVLLSLFLDDRGDMLL
jgi:hypothetical protein